ncbi:hypothetical protein [Filimonas effusa]|uniref:Uncharacterized protein n=1 Tax=Filimonas effusa TaxID=2508721 RepID=A0A4Q1D9U5_9BACT|nr:hypothetical protein [Filimonas effusa]RXK85990.1 hypothetical protein ESB13_04045 [Filimonas effusa]
MQLNYFMLIFAGLYLAGTGFYDAFAKRKGIVFRYKPITLLIVALLFLVALYGVITGKPFNEILPFIR